MSDEGGGSSRNDFPKTGALNLITDVPGLLVGHAISEQYATGTSVILAPEQGALAAVDTRGGAPGTRETDALAPGNLVDRAHAIVLSGGSAFGLEAAGGVMNWLAAQGRGFPVAGTRVPIVPAAIIFDLANGGAKDWGDSPPYNALGKAACGAASKQFDLGPTGAGFGAKTARAGHGIVSGGLGSASVLDPQSGYTVGALVVVNAVGSPYMPDGETLWAAPFELDGEFSGIAGMSQDAPSTNAMPPRTEGQIVTKRPMGAGENTTIAVIATNAPFDIAGLQRLAIMAHDGLARAIHPIHTPFDGDVVFALSTAQSDDFTSVHGDAVLLARLGSLGADCMARAVGRGMLAVR